MRGTIIIKNIDFVMELKLMVETFAIDTEETVVDLHLMRGLEGKDIGNDGNI